MNYDEVWVMKKRLIYLSKNVLIEELKTLKGLKD